MADILIKPENSKSGDTFVGMKFESVNGDKPSVVSAIFPLGYHYEENQETLKKELYELLCVIRRHSKNNDSESIGNIHTDKSVRFPFDAYITVIRDFMGHGYYIEREVRHKHAPMGKINWRRTIAQVRPTIQGDGSPVYTDFIVRQNAKKTDNMISLIHEWCVYEAFKVFGWYFGTSFVPHKSTLKIGEDRQCFISIIFDALKSTFNDRNKTLFNAMIAMLRHGGTDGKNAFSYGTTCFETVWENLIDTYYGVGEKEKKDYFPDAEWVMANDPKNPQSANKLRPDTIMQIDDNKDVFVLDSKYYSEKNLPGASDINKQVTYGKYAKDKVKESGKVYNAFIIPYDFEKEDGQYGNIKQDHLLRTKDNKMYGGYVGYARMVEEKISESDEHKRVLGILIDTKWLIQNAGTINKDELKTGLAEFIRRIVKIINE